MFMCARKRSRVVVPPSAGAVGAGGMTMLVGGGGIGSHITSSRTSFPRSTDDGSVECAWVAITLPLVMIPYRLGSMVDTNWVGAGGDAPVRALSLTVTPAPLPNETLP